MIAKYALAYLSTAVLFALIDLAWLTTSINRLYRPAIGELLTDKPRFEAAVAFYVIYLCGIIVFAVTPAFATHRWETALIQGALYGFFASATYNLSNRATLKIWPVKVTLLDMLWGSVVSSLAGAGGYLITIALTGH